ncbi:MAG TPA: TonB-dependent receptor [Bryobacteraceae bacterium]|nr:TonB-dependent receptor [Bryobacteraceae bacterium]
MKTSLCGVFLGVLFFSAPLLAQFESSELLGTVRDPAGLTVPKATVTILHQETGIQTKSVTDENGNYDFFNVKVGRYTVTVEATGFVKFSTPDVDVAVNARQRVDASLQVGAVTDSVEVKDAASALDTDSSQRGQVVNGEAIQELPLNGRNYSDLALVATNVHRSVYAYAVPPREGAFNANGMRSTYNNFLLDGVDNNPYSTSNQGYSNQVGQPSPDAVQEFKVIVGNYSAEYGRVGGAIVNVVMRSGTNAFHGALWEFVRNTDLNAIGYIFGQRPSTFQKPTLQRNQFGTTIGGPIIKNKLFFFADYEGLRNLTKSLNFDSLPDTADRSGLLMGGSSLSIPLTVVNPLTGSVYQGGTPIPTSAMTPLAAKVLSQLPALTTTSGRSNDYEALLLVRDYADKYDAKVDYQINDRMSAFLRFSQHKENQYYQPTIAGPDGGDGNGNVRILDQNAVASYTWSVTAASLLDVRLGFSHVTGGKFPVFLGGPSALDLYGLTGLSTAPFLTGGLNTQNISGFTGMGRQATNPQFQNPTNWDPKANYSWAKGRHALKFGVEGGIIHTEVMDINPVYGLQAYASHFSMPSSCAQIGQATGCVIPTDSSSLASYNLADFMFGLPSQIQLSNYLVGSYRQRQFFSYVQDDFRVNSKLTLNLGLRWEFATPRWERDNVLSNFNPATNSIITAKNGGLYDRTLVNPDYKDWAPRLGLAYTFDQQTVVRGGYGISYVHLNRLGSADELGINGPQVNQVTINNTNPLNNPNFITQTNSFPPGLNGPQNFNPVNANIAYIPANTRWPYVQTWFVSIQRELMKDTVVELTYSGNHSSRLPIVSDYNQAVANLPGQTLGIQARRPDQSFGAITWVNPSGISTYNGLAARLEHRFSHGLYFLNSFTWSKALGDSEQALETATLQALANPQNIYNLKAERGPSSFDVQFINVTTLVYQLPFGKGRQFGSSWSPVLDGVLGGWEINTINTANTGLPIDVAYTPGAANDVTGRIPDYRGEAVMRPNLVGNPTDLRGTSMLDHYLDPAAFQVPSASAPFGNLGRNSFRTPGLWTWDFAVYKGFRIRENVALQFRSEFFNGLNRSNFTFPDPNISDSAFGTIRSTYPARQIQFALKLQY